MAPTLDPARAPTVNRHDSGSPELAMLAPPGSIPDPLKTWDRYEIVRPLGQGGMGTVFLARDRKLGRQVALKFLRVPSPEAADRLLQEARAQARLDHNHICKVFEVGEFRSQPYIAMEFIDGQPLHLALRRLSLEQKVLLVQQLALAVHSAHSQGVLHRDLKPANVMVCESVGDSSVNGSGGLRPVLMDFGLAHDSLGPQRLTQTGVIMGTPAYMAPEQARGMARQLDRRADVYSLGAMLYELLCGRPPFDAENEVDLLMAVLHQDPPPLRQYEAAIPIDLEIVVHKCLRKEPNQRYDSAQALADDLGRYLRGEPILARPATTLYKLRRLAARHRAPFAVGAVVLVSIFALLTMWGQARAQRRRAEVQAAEQERLAVQLGQSVTEMKLFLRVAYSLPPHDLRRDKEVVRARLRKLAGQLKESDPFVHGTIESALGQGYLTLEEYEAAVQHLQRAIDLGENTTGTHLAIGEALTQLYQNRAEETRRQFDPAESTRRLAELARTYLPRARQELLLGKHAELAAPSYVESLLQRYADHPDLDRALLLVRQAKEESPWQLEPMLQEISILTDASRQIMLSGRHSSQQQMDEMQRILDRAISTARSYPRFYQAHAEFVGTRLRENYTEPRPVGELEPLYRQGIEQAKILSVLLPDDGTALDTLAGVHSALAFLLAWKQQDPRGPAQEGLAVLAAAQKLPPPRARTSRAEMNLRQSIARYLDYLDEDATAEYEATLRAAKRAAELSPEEPESWAQYALAETLLADSKHQRGMDARQEMRHAIESAQRALRSQPDKLLWRNNLGAYYIYLAQMESHRGSDPNDSWRRARAEFQQVLDKNPSFQLSEENALEVEQNEVRFLIAKGELAVEQAQRMRRHSEQLLSKYPSMASIQGYHLGSLLLQVEAMMESGHSPLPLIDEVATIIGSPSLSGIALGHRQDAQAQLELFRLRWLIQSGQSPDDALSALLVLAPLHGISLGGMRTLRQQLQIEALRRYAEWLMTPSGRQNPHAARSKLPRTALLAVESALALAIQARERPGPYRYQVQSEQAILWLLKARLDPKADVAALSSGAQKLFAEVLKDRPLLQNKLRPYLATQPS
jgi:serine/threonine-protein kinase